MPTEISLDNVGKKLAERGIRVIAIDVQTMPGYGLDDTANTGPLGTCAAPVLGQLPQGTTLATVTGGKYYKGITAGTIVQAIVQSVTATVLCIY